MCENPLLDPLELLKALFNKRECRKSRARNMKTRRALDMFTDGNSKDRAIGFPRHTINEKFDSTQQEQGKIRRVNRMKREIYRTTSHNNWETDSRQRILGVRQKGKRSLLGIPPRSGRRRGDEGVNTNNCYKRSILVRELERYLFCVQKSALRFATDDVHDNNEPTYLLMFIINSFKFFFSLFPF